MTANVRHDDWETSQQFDAAQRLADSIDAVAQIANALKTSGVAYSLTLGNFANDAAAAAGGIEIGQLYRNGSVVQVRVA